MGYFNKDRFELYLNDLLGDDDSYPFSTSPLQITDFRKKLSIRTGFGSYLKDEHIDSLQVADIILEKQGTIFEMDVHIGKIVLATISEDYYSSSEPGQYEALKISFFRPIYSEGVLVIPRMSYKAVLDGSCEKISNEKYNSMVFPGFDSIFSRLIRFSRQDDSLKEKLDFSSMII